MATPKYLGHRIEILCFGILMWTSILMAVVQLIGAFEANNELQLDELLCRKCGHGITIADDLTSVPTRKALRQRNDTVSKQKDTLIQLFENPQGLKFELITTRKADVKTLGEILFVGRKLQNTLGFLAFHGLFVCVPTVVFILAGNLTLLMKVKLATCHFLV
ncbi:uncharacterized protein LOC135689354 isoform X2 [Rhopilema esculentum]|uniref:uncharacterized protein LOC135689354 isoform X2 n=1 Tax=Rhopilema esculentum TaxID=499914 RepID=UPI0031E46767